NLRIRQAGHKVWLDPKLSVTYWPRESWWRLARQFRATGAWRGELVRRFGRSNGLRFFAPPALVLNLALALIVAVLQLTGAVGAVTSLVASIVYLPLIVYALLVLAMALRPGGERSLRERIWTLAVLPTMHVSWGLGFIGGI